MVGWKGEERGMQEKIVPKCNIFAIMGDAYGATTRDRWNTFLSPFNFGSFFGKKIGIRL